MRRRMFRKPINGGYIYGSINEIIIDESSKVSPAYFEYITTGLKSMSAWICRKVLNKTSIYDFSETPSADLFNT